MTCKYFLLNVILNKYHIYGTYKRVIGHFKVTETKQFDLNILYICIRI